MLKFNNVNYCSRIYKIIYIIFLKVYANLFLKVEFIDCLLLLHNKVDFYFKNTILRQKDLF